MTELKEGDFLFCGECKNIKKKNEFNKCIVCNKMASYEEIQNSYYCNKCDKDIFNKTSYWRVRCLQCYKIWKEEQDAIEKQRLEQEKRDIKKYGSKKYVVYHVELDTDRLRRSEFYIVGIYSSYDFAVKVMNKYIEENSIPNDEYNYVRVSLHQYMNKTDLFNQEKNKYLLGK